MKYRASRRLTWFIAPLLAGSLACSSGKPDAADPSSSSTGVRSAEQNLPPLEAVSAPADILLRIRVKNPQRFMDQLGETTGLPREALEELSIFLERLAQLPITWEAPLELFSQLPSTPKPNTHTLFSVGVSSVQEARDQLTRTGFDPIEGTQGVYYFKQKNRRCALGRSLGKSPGRIVCQIEKDTQASFLELLPYALRGLPQERLSEADIYMELDPKSLIQTHEKTIRSLKMLASVAARQFHRDEPRFDRAVTEIATGVAEELIFLSQEIQLVQGEFSHQKEQFEGTLSFQFKGHSSWFVQTLREMLNQQAPAPQEMRQFPAQVSSASYQYHPSAARLAPLKQALTDLAVGWAQSEKLSPALANRLERIVAEMFTPGPYFVSASGPLVERNNQKTPYSTYDWNLVGSLQPVAKLSQVLDDVSALLQSRELPVSAEDRKLFPQFTRRAAGIPGLAGSRVYQWKLPPELHKLIQEADEDKARNKEDMEHMLSLWKEGYVVLYPHQGITWVGITSQLDGLSQVLRDLGKSSVPRLDERAELQNFLQHPSLNATFIGFDGILSVLGPYFPAQEIKEALSYLGSAPYQGKVPFFYFAQGQIQGDRTEWELKLEIPQGFLADGVHLLREIIDAQEETPEE